MQNIDFDSFPSHSSHQCDSYRQGDWIVFICPSCSDYERRINLRTGEIKVKNSSPEIMHSGTHAPYGLDEINLN